MSDASPSILIPFQAPRIGEPSQDVFVYLRPETNGIRVESALMKAVSRNSHYGDDLKVVYLANIPGRFILDRHVVEQHYAVRLHFAVLGREAFTERMKQRFEAYFQVPFAEARIMGAFEALQELHLGVEELFNLWVEPFDIIILNGQSIKRYGEDYIVNYDIPALLHKNTHQTDIAVMVFRFGMGWELFRGLLADINQSLVQQGILDPHKPSGRVFHYSKSPFEQILDAEGYLLDRECQNIPLTECSFGRYLMAKGVTVEEIREVLRNPIMEFQSSRGTVEENILDYTQNCSYEEAWQKYCQKSRVVPFR